MEVKFCYVWNFLRSIKSNLYFHMDINNIHSKFRIPETKIRDEKAAIFMKGQQFPLGILG